VLAAESKVPDAPSFVSRVAWLSLQFASALEQESGTVPYRKIMRDDRARFGFSEKLTLQ
jgi:hypothetical protein